MTDTSCLIVTDENLQDVLDAPLALLDFWAPWCGPCRALSPTLDDLADEYDGRAIIAKLNVDDYSDIAQKYGVMSIPTILILHDGVEAERLVGVQTKESLALLLDAAL